MSLQIQQFSPRIKDMADKFLTTDSYKGVRDFYPEDMAIQRYIFDVWSQTAESFGFERYDASVLEPAELYKNKGAENEELVNEQTYTFIDRGDRTVTLRPEMTPTVARMVAGKRRELSFPIRWYSIPNLFRYERPQRGRLREHWQLNCDIFGADDYTADVEIIALASQLIRNFGADDSLFEIRINDRAEMTTLLTQLDITNLDTQSDIIKLNDRFHKISKADYLAALTDITKNPALAERVYTIVSGNDATDTNQVVTGLRELGITNVKIDRSIARGFNYYTGTIFEIFDVSGENNRSMLGGGRYDNLTGMFSADAISGIGFGMGDVTMRDFLETHNLVTASITAPTIMVVPMTPAENLAGQKIASLIRRKEITVATDISTRKIGKKISEAAEKLVEYVLVVGEDEIASGTYTLKNLLEGTSTSGSIEELIIQLTDQ
jgi:histidyl-tRNA synthetase